MSERLVRKHGPKINPQLEPGERIRDVVSGIALATPRRGRVDPTLRVGGRLASHLQGSDKRVAGVVCITDRRVLFFRTGLTSIKDLCGQLDRSQISGLQRVDGVRLMYALVMTDGSMATFAGTRHDHIAVATALDMVIDLSTEQGRPEHDG